MEGQDDTSNSDPSGNQPPIIESVRWWVLWAVFSWDSRAIKKKLQYAGLLILLLIPIVPGLVDGIFLTVAALVFFFFVFGGTILGIANLAGIIDLSEGQNAVRRLFSFVTGDIPDLIEAILEWLFGR